MVKMTSAEAQNQFGKLLDTARCMNCVDQVSRIRYQHPGKRNIAPRFDAGCSSAKGAPFFSDLRQR